ncbi:hypothetical protein SETIT_8G093900v2 [Setaria italica]|uniref:R13L1/DRL21-like LRR repeat region domain-containing protein n=1 Tax=Setaria italica TaxID=4555 RepID=A0A368S657_SETIT|nr:hypothetical protein SETIT_8G093900v2 [Setaria italica]
MQHFLVPGNNSLHSDILNVGNLKLLRELRRFEAKKENKGFELKQLAELLELEVLGIYNLEKVKVKEEAVAIKLIQKHHLQDLVLDWDINRSNKDPIGEENILESLMPHSNLWKLSITGHGGDTCPSWLGMNLSVKTLESLRLSNVSWKTFPPLGEMWFVGEHCKSCIPEQSFKKLKRLELEKVPKLIKWVGNGPSDLFSHLEVLVINECPELMELAEIVQAGSDIERLSFRGHILEIKGKDTLDSAFWRVLAFHNLSKLQVLQLSSLEHLWINDMGDAFCSAEGDGHAGYQFPVKYVTIGQYGASGQRLTRLFSYFPNLLIFRMFKCEKLTGLGVVGLHKRMEALPRPPSISVNQVEEAQVGQHEQQGARAEEEIAAAATSEGVLLLPHQLQDLSISDCQNLVLCPGLLDHDEDEGRTGGGGLQELLIRECGDLKGEGLQSLLAQGRLTKLTVRETPKFFAGSEPSLPREQELPSSSSKLQELGTDDVAGLLAAPICAFLSSSLTELNFSGVKEVERFTKEQEETLQLLTSLERIGFSYCDKLQCLPAGLHRLSNLKRLDIDTCKAICSLPKDGLPGSLQELVINDCQGIRSIHKECLPNSLQKLEIRRCPGIRSLPKVEYLPISLRELVVGNRNSEELRRHCRKLIGTIPIVRA